MNAEPSVPWPAMRTLLPAQLLALAVACTGPAGTPVVDATTEATTDVAVDALTAPEPTPTPSPATPTEAQAPTPTAAAPDPTSGPDLATPLAPPTTGPAPTASPAADAPDAIPAGTQRAMVTWIIDGDTIDVEPLEDGDVPFGEQRIRLLEIDTPERDDSCYETATDLLAELIPVGTEVHLERDTENTDPNGRYLRYVWSADEGLVNLTMVAEGMAEAFIFPLNQIHAAEVRAAEAEAQDLGLGIWGPFCDNRP